MGGGGGLLIFKKIKIYDITNPTFVIIAAARAKLPEIASPHLTAMHVFTFLS